MINNNIVRTKRVSLQGRFAASPKVNPWGLRSLSMYFGPGLSTPSKRA